MSTHNKILARVVKDELTDNYGKFIIQPLERGFGITVGNALRRVLLTSIPGIAISSIKIDDVLHEFSSIKGVKEDVSEIILNIKQVCLKPIENKIDKLKIHLTGPCEFKAGDIAKENPLVEILNPELVICTLNKDADFELEMRGNCKSTEITQKEC